MAGHDNPSAHPQVSQAFRPDEGDTLLSLGAGYAPPAAFEHLVWTGQPFASLTYIDPVWFRHDFAQDLNPKAAAELSDHQQPIAFPILTTPSEPAAWHSIPSWFAIGGADRMIDPALQRAEASRIGATTVVFDDSSHAGGFTHYAARVHETYRGRRSGDGALNDPRVSTDGPVFDLKDRTRSTT